MPKIVYVERNMSEDSLEVVRKSNEIIATYAAQGYKLTLRQLYYQHVSRGFIPNNMKSYKRLGEIVNNWRLAGLIDWDAIEDRTREVVTPSRWGSPAEIVEACAFQYRIDKWAAQEYRPEVWIEKEALAGVVERVCRELDISYLSCRGYTSQSEMWGSAMRLAGFVRKGQTPVILHFGDHDPSGIDMTRDIRNRLDLFMGGIELRRLALNMPQIEEYNPPPNPAKTTDSRYSGYMAEFGDESWELDALEPSMLVQLIRDEVAGLRDEALWAEAEENEEGHRERLAQIAEDLSNEE